MPHRAQCALTAPLRAGSSGGLGSAAAAFSGEVRLNAPPILVATEETCKTVQIPKSLQIQKSSKFYERSQQMVTVRIQSRTRTPLLELKDVSNLT